MDHQSLSTTNGSLMRNVLQYFYFFSLLAQIASLTQSPIPRIIQASVILAFLSIPFLRADLSSPFCFPIGIFPFWFVLIVYIYTLYVHLYYNLFVADVAVPDAERYCSQKNSPSLSSIEHMNYFGVFDCSQSPIRLRHSFVFVKWPMMRVDEWWAATKANKPKRNAYIYFCFSLFSISLSHSLARSHFVRRKF